MTREEVKSTVVEALSEFFDSDRTVSIAEAGRMLKKSRVTIYSMISRGELTNNNKGVFLNSIRKIQLRTLKSS
jgi:hypothetical protein